MRALALALALLAFASGCARNLRKEPAPPEYGEGLASYYGAGLDGRKTASGEVFDKDALTAAHRSLRFGTCVAVTNLGNGRSVKVRVNDRGPFVKGRVIDVSEAAGRELGMLDAGVARVRLEACE